MNRTDCMTSGVLKENFCGFSKIEFPSEIQFRRHQNMHKNMVKKKIYEKLKDLKLSNRQ